MSNDDLWLNLNGRRSTHGYGLAADSFAKVGRIRMMLMRLRWWQEARRG